MTELSSDYGRQALYSRMLSRIQEDPYSQLVWDRTVALAKDEENKSSVKNFYSRVPLDELVEVGEQLRLKKDRASQYEILAQRSSMGIRWYDIILGHVNDKMFAAVNNRLLDLLEERGKRFAHGLDIGTGTGNTIRTISPYFEHVTGLDKQEGILQKEKNSGAFPKNVDVVVADAKGFPLQKDSIDIAVSNGLTYYLSKQELEKFIDELARVIKRGGIYFQGMILKRDANSQLPIIEEEYLESAKGLLVCLVDNIVTFKDKPTDWNISDMYNMFTSRGFECDTSDPDENGVWHMEFRKL